MRSILCPVFMTVLFASSLMADVTTKQRRELSSIKVSIRKAGSLYNEKDYAESSKLIIECQIRLEKLLEGAEADLLRQSNDVIQSLGKARALLEFEGVEIPAMKVPSEPSDAAGAISFSKSVARILVSKCGQCHVNNSRGGLSMANYASLLRGTPDNNQIVVPNDPVGSRMIEAIESGDMPRGGLEVAAEELEVLKTWIAAGAQFDGEDPQVAISTLVPDAEVTQAPRVEVTAATGNETLKFSEDIAPILVDQCVSCHGGGQRPGGRFDLASFQRMLRGGDSGPPVLPGKPADSLLIKKLKGTGGGERMPRGRPPLADDVIARIEKWIEEGARFDAADAEQNITRMVAIVRANKLSHEELSRERAELAGRNWDLALPGVNSSTGKTTNLLLKGTMGQASLDDYATKAEAVAVRIGKMLRVPTGQPMVKGRITLFLTASRYNYTEFAGMVDRRQEIPSGENGYWNYSTVDAYGVVLLRPTADDVFDGLVGQQIAGAYVASLGESPRWFTEGIARAVAARLSPKDPRFAAWNAAIPGIISGARKPEDFLGGQLPPDEADVVAYSFMKFLMNDSRRFNKMLGAVRDGVEFSVAFGGTYGGTPDQVIMAWVRSPKR